MFSPLRPFARIAFLWLALASSLLAQSSSRTGNSSSRSSSSSASSSSRNGNSSSANGNSSTSATARQYRSNTMLGDATVQIDPESRSVVIVTDEATHNEMSKLIDDLDHPKPQVLIKVVFAEITLDKNLDVGVDGSYTFKVGHSGSSSTIESLLGLAQQANGSYAVLANSHWSATLTALQTHGNVKILSRPSIMARNNQEAVIVVGQEVPFVTNSQITDAGSTINTITYKDVGIILRVTPFINRDKTVEMIVGPEISSLSSETVAISTTANAPVINKRSAETVVVTPNATTVVIGGLMQKQETSSIKKVPILGDIPIIGFPFRHTVKSESKSELLIFLTPYIVESTAKLKQLTLQEANASEVIRDGFTPEEVRNTLAPLQLLPDPCLPIRTGTVCVPAAKR